MKAIIAALCIALVPLEMSGQSLAVSSVIPAAPLIVRPPRPTLELSPGAGSVVKLVAPVITRVRPQVLVAPSLRPQCNMLVAMARPDSEVAGSGQGGAIVNRAVPILTERAMCVNAFATPLAADTGAVKKP